MDRSHQLIEFRRDNCERLKRPWTGLFPSSREGKTRAGSEFEEDMKLLLAVSAPLVKTVGPVEQVTLYEVSPMPRAMY